MDSFWIELFKFLGILVTVGVPNIVAYAKLRSKLDDQHSKVEHKLDHSIARNETQIDASNNFNTKLEKLTTQNTNQTMKLNQIERKIDRVDRDLRTLSEATGIALEPQ